MHGNGRNYCQEQLDSVQKVPRTNDTSIAIEACRSVAYIATVIKKLSPLPRLMC